MHVEINMVITHQDSTEGLFSTTDKNLSYKNKSKGTKKFTWKYFMLQDDNYLNSLVVGELWNKLWYIN